MRHRRYTGGHANGRGARKLHHIAIRIDSAKMKRVGLLIEEELVYLSNAV
ncbi:hypothetical protein M5X00_25390 [Paenibacillus alvei]|nr:hypothetical protein [Paenibacillus alvei]MCY7486881.1 hypothetical protein [Paenibacillus alvei]MCY9544617.1 hypothetical protein [Paenibacillus alvei]MCY9582538.1 hypothetical protein [Paenibacillus alvei]MCY9583606.1 hypothetical protein [Paenibacillus alvei]MCY9706412.1 hypothetical protein [Paenibacillus alvei]